MTAFRGFQDSETFTAIPDTLFRELLAVITDAGELKVVLHSMWSIEHMDSAVRAMTSEDFEGAALGLRPAQLKAGLARAVEHGILLRVGRGKGTRYLLNSPRGRTNAAAMAEGTSRGAEAVSLGPMERPNIFQLYEENIGPLTPLIADALKDAEDTYPAAWIVESIDLAVKNNKRSWSYCQAILRRWKEEGRGKKQTGRDAQAARQRDVEEKIRKFIRG